MSDAEESQSSDGSQIRSSASFSLEKRWVIFSKGQKWVPQCKQDSHQRDYIQVGKFDRSFVKFCLGKGMVVGKRSANVPAFDKLLENRKAASRQSMRTPRTTARRRGRFAQRTNHLWMASSILSWRRYNGKEIHLEGTVPVHCGAWTKTLCGLS